MAIKSLNMHLDSLLEISQNTKFDEIKRFEIFKKMFQKLERHAFSKIQ
jgi:hypothetical protein